MTPNVRPFPFGCDSAGSGSLDIRHTCIPNGQTPKPGGEFKEMDKLVSGRLLKSFLDQLSYLGMRVRSTITSLVDGFCAGSLRAIANCFRFRHWASPGMGCTKVVNSPKCQNN